MTKTALKEFLDKKVIFYNNPAFIENDPIAIPHLFTKQQDIEIAAFFAAILSWGQRKTILNKCRQLMHLMGNAPHEFILHHREKDLKSFLSFRHRTFQPDDLLYFIHFLKNHYSKNISLENAFAQFLDREDSTVEKALAGFNRLFFSLPEAPARTRKHVATPAKKSACKRLNMFLRWMVRKDNKGVDFGMWKTIHPAQLVCPIDVHVARVSQKLGLASCNRRDWKAATELTLQLKALDPEDPVKYDFALFGLGVAGEY